MQCLPPCFVCQWIQTWILVSVSMLCWWATLVFESFSLPSSMKIHLCDLHEYIRSVNRRSQFLYICLSCLTFDSLASVGGFVVNHQQETPPQKKSSTSSRCSLLSSHYGACEAFYIFILFAKENVFAPWTWCCCRDDLSYRCLYEPQSYDMIRTCQDKSQYCIVTPNWYSDVVVTYCDTEPFIAFLWWKIMSLKENICVNICFV